MRIKSKQNTTLITPKNFSSQSTLKMIAQHKQKFFTQPSTPKKTKKTYYRSFHNHSSKNNKTLTKNHSNIDKIKPQELIDQKLIKLIQDIKYHNGFRGATNTNSRNQLLYLQPKKRYQDKGKSLGHIKQSLYKGVLKNNKQQNVHENIQNRMINYFTQYDPEICQPLKSNSIKRHGLLKVKNNNIRQRLKTAHKQSLYFQKVKNYTRLFNNINKF